MNKILNKDLFLYYSELRQNLLDLLGDIKDYNRFDWDNTTPNYITRNKIVVVFDKYIKNAKELGLHLVDRHGDCGSKSHKDDYISEKLKMTSMG